MQAYDPGELKAFEAERLERERRYDEELEKSISSNKFRDNIVPIYRRYVPKNNSIAQVNKNTGLPHEHKREIARRLRRNNGN